MRRLLVVLAVLLAGLGLSACEDTHSAFCNDTIPSQNHTITDVYGWHLNCAPPFAQPPSESGWADPKTSTVYIWPDGLSADLLKVIAWHEAGHVRQDYFGLQFATQTDREVNASEYAWCQEPIYGVGMPGYGPPPEGCSHFSTFNPG